MTAVPIRHFSGSTAKRMRLLGQDCHVEVSGLGRHAGSVFIEVPCHDCCFSHGWRQSETGVQLSQTSESSRLTRFWVEGQHVLWTKRVVRRRICRWLQQQDKEVASWLSWNDGTVVKLAYTIASQRTYKLLPILADALQEAGCTDASFLSACRGAHEGTYASWVIDMLLGDSMVQGQEHLRREAADSLP